MTKSFPTRTTVANFLADRLADSDKTQREIAEECGFPAPNIITMLKKGDTKLPIDRIGALAKSLDVDAAHLLRLAMSEYLPETWNAIEDILKSTILSANELQLVREYRRATGDNDAVAVVINRDAVIAIVAA